MTDAPLTMSLHVSVFAGICTIMLQGIVIVWPLFIVTVPPRLVVVGQTTLSSTVACLQEAGVVEAVKVRGGDAARRRAEARWRGERADDPRRGGARGGLAAPPLA